MRGRGREEEEEEEDAEWKQALKERERHSGLLAQSVLFKSHFKVRVPELPHFNYFKIDWQIAHCTRLHHTTNS